MVCRKNMSDELTTSQTQTLSKSLELLKVSLESSLSMSKDSVKPVDLDEPIGRLSRMDAIQQKEMASTNRRNLAIRLQQVNAAIGAVQRDEYGECNRCGDDIGFKRLTAKPEAPLCLNCQNEIEQR
ncbi:MAG TPA: TraR/DksA family transcriptional regulator [Myxococcales bacterium]|nr:TraR/DksA family transcriptional regulator [Myxococcales bacterium]HIN86785.1 TraR/DksA family transcriptional regulator [Myxococcales bacterium]